MHHREIASSAERKAKGKSGTKKKDLFLNLSDFTTPNVGTKTGGWRVWALKRPCRNTKVLPLGLCPQACVGWLNASFLSLTFRGH